MAPRMCMGTHGHQQTDRLSADQLDALGSDYVLRRLLKNEHLQRLLVSNLSCFCFAPFMIVSNITVGTRVCYSAAPHFLQRCAAGMRDWFARLVCYSIPYFASHKYVRMRWRAVVDGCGRGR